MQFGDEKEPYFEGVPSIVLPVGPYCDACGREIRGCCLNGEPDYCRECFSFYKEYILKGTIQPDKRGWAFSDDFINPCTGALGPDYWY